MKQEIYSFPEQYEKALRVFDDASLTFKHSEYRNFYLCGLGGSSLPGDIMNSLFEESVHLEMVRDYTIPQKDNYEKSFFFINSFSGNTEEILSCLEQVPKTDADFVVLAHGGKLEHIAKEKGYNFLKVPDCAQPRLAAGFFVTLMTNVLIQMGIVSSDHREKLLTLKDFLQNYMERLEQEGKRIAPLIKGKIPVIYTDKYLACEARIWKINFNENSKTQSFWNQIPEMNHNEMCGYTHLVMQPIVIYLVSQFIHPKNLKRMQVMEKIYAGEFNFETVHAKGNSLMEEIFYLHIMSAWVSYYLALEYGIDPAPVEIVERFKKLM